MTSTDNPTGLTRPKTQYRVKPRPRDHPPCHDCSYLGSPYTWHRAWDICTWWYCWCGKQWFKIGFQHWESQHGEMRHL